jgi:hypothetical protein
MADKIPQEKPFFPELLSRYLYKVPHPHFFNYIYLLFMCLIVGGGCGWKVGKE